MSTIGCTLFIYVRGYVFDMGVTLLTQLEGRDRETPGADGVEYALVLHVKDLSQVKCVQRQPVLLQQVL